jgi:thymidylate synthase
MQFIYRNDKLDALVFMRSNDIILGLPYDIFVFTMLQEMMAIELGIELGTYHHIVGSLHAYAEDEELCRKLTSSPITNPVAMPPMRDIASVQPFLAYEARIRQGAPLPPCVDLDPYWMDLLRVLSWHSEKRRGQAPFSILGAPEAPLYRQMLTTAPTRVMAA